MALSEICMVVDLDGFYLRERFRTREFGYASLTKKNRCQSYRFDLKYLFPLDDKEWKTVIFCQRRVHGLTLRPMFKEPVWPERELGRLVEEAYRENRTEKRYLVAYKGGSHERNLLDELEIPSVDLESFGCPKYDDLAVEDVRDCGYHKKLTGGGQIHCSRKECVAFAKWVDCRLQKAKYDDY